MDKKELYRLIEAYNKSGNSTSIKSAINIQEFENVINKYPYFQTTRLLYTKELHLAKQDQFCEELSKTALFCADRKKLFYLIQPEDYIEFFKLPDEEAADYDRTEEILDSYFKTFSDNTLTNSNNNIEETGLEMPYSDYFSYLESLGEESDASHSGDFKLQHQDIIDAFIENNESNTIGKLPFKNDQDSKHDNTKASNDIRENDNDSEFLTETLAKIYIKQKKYDKALTIIKRLSLNFPKKSAYFADQIRFLEYLIINDKQNS